MLSSEKGSIPLYIQIKELLVAKISKGNWAAGDIIPSEMQLAQELDVSQGTVRKAITELVEKNVLVRKQGKGTFVANHDTRRALFHFFHLTENNGYRVLPESTVLHCRRKKPTRKEASKLRLAADSRIIRIERMRYLSNKPTMIETITLPEVFFADFGKANDCKLPNMLYELYEQQYGITIHSADEQLRAIPASKQDATLLNIETGTPLLEIERVALTLDKTPIELRISRCITSNHYYENALF
jgi:GntR family transcriptional regulator